MLKVISLYIAGLIVVMHTVMPHSHCNTMFSAEQVTSEKPSDTFLGHIKMMLNIDMGDGHLEHFQSGNGLDVDMNDAIAQVAILAIVFDQTYLISNKHSYLPSEHYLKEDPFPDPPFKSAFSLRGPPSIS
ncbi:hypothetical protein [Portibacter lacus]|uniref:Uncharacterized protein n=1 Tax=Portibacter lacus TaxID=1099794 RepID=A0AA37SPR3_9BACT|nr:hypothetical protein [Portibacter lacus]GLR17614.1 hypothetical protein GCM10007940_22290 [Portibacter lacus]